MMNLATDVQEIASRHSLAGVDFDGFRLLSRQRLLLRDGFPVRLGSRAFDLLNTLATRAGEIVPHAELIQAAWPNRVVSDCNLKVQIGSVQKVLGVAPFGGRYIKSVALRGYVFVADVQPVSWLAARQPASGGHWVA